MQQGNGSILILAAAFLLSFPNPEARANKCNKVSPRKEACKQIRSSNVEKCEDALPACDAAKEFFQKAHAAGEKTCNDVKKNSEAAAAAAKAGGGQKVAQARSAAFKKKIAGDFKKGKEAADALKEEKKQVRERVVKGLECIVKEYKEDPEKKEVVEAAEEALKKAESGAPSSGEAGDLSDIVSDIDKTDSELGDNSRSFAENQQDYERDTLASGGRETDLGNEGGSKPSETAGSPSPEGNSADSGQGDNNGGNSGEKKPEGGGPQGDQQKQQAGGGQPPPQENKPPENTITSNDMRPENNDITRNIGKSKTEEEAKATSLASSSFVGGNDEDAGKATDKKVGGGGSHTFAPRFGIAASSGGPAAASLAQTSGSSGHDSSRSQFRTSASSTGLGGSGSSAPALSESGSSEKRERIPLWSKSGSGSSSDSSYSSGGGVSNAPSDDPAAAFTKPLGDPKFSLMGSETDDQIRQMVGTFNKAEGNAKLEPASEWEDGIGDKYGASLFERAHYSHENCMRRGCVTANVFRRTAAR